MRRARSRTAGSRSSPPSTSNGETSLWRPASPMKSTTSAKGFEDEAIASIRPATSSPCRSTPYGRRTRPIICVKSEGDFVGRHITTTSAMGRSVPSVQTPTLQRNWRSPALKSVKSCLRTSSLVLPVTTSAVAPLRRRISAIRVACSTFTQKTRVERSPARFRVTDDIFRNGSSISRAFARSAPFKSPAVVRTVDRSSPPTRSTVTRGFTSHPSSTARRIGNSYATRSKTSPSFFLSARFGVAVKPRRGTPTK